MAEQWQRKGKTMAQRLHSDGTAVVKNDKQCMEPRISTTLVIPSCNSDGIKRRCLIGHSVMVFRRNLVALCWFEF